MDKSELIKALTQGLRKEEASIKVYTHHIKQASTRSNLTREEVSRISDVLTALKDGSIKHRDIVSNLIEQLEKDPRNDI